MMMIMMIRAGDVIKPLKKQQQQQPNDNDDKVCHFVVAIFFAVVDHSTENVIWQSVHFFFCWYNLIIIIFSLN